MEETGHVQVYLGGEEEAASEDDSVLGSESETEDESLETAPPDSSDCVDGGLRNSMKKIVKVFKREKKPHMARATSSKSSLSGSESGSMHGSTSGSVHGSVSGSGDGLDSLAGSVTEPLPSNIPDYYAEDEYFFGYPKRGHAVIINNEEFDSEIGYGNRDGAKKDTNKLKDIFKKLGFRVKTYKDLQGKQIEAKMKKMAERDHKDKDCFACAILTHGKQQRGTKRGDPVKCDIVFGTDGEGVTTDALMTLFSDENCPSLTGKPRLFFIQACRGERHDKGSLDAFPCETAQMTWKSGGDAKDALDPGTPDKDEEDIFVDLSVPRHRDFLVAYATPPGYYAWRNKEGGSWFIQSLWRAVEDAEVSAKLEEKSLLDLLTLCSYIQATDFEAKNKTKSKSVPHITHMLTKEVYFRPKSKASR